VAFGEWVVGWFDGWMVGWLKSLKSLSSFGHAHGEKHFTDTQHLTPCLSVCVCVWMGEGLSVKVGECGGFLTA